MLLKFSEYRIQDLFPSPYALSDAEEFIARITSADPETAFAIANSKEAFGVIGFIPGQDVYRHSAGVFSSNPASARVLEKAGFSRDAVLRAHVTKNGEVLDEHLFSRLRPGLVG